VNGSGNAFGLSVADSAWVVGFDNDISPRSPLKLIIFADTTVLCRVLGFLFGVASIFIPIYSNRRSPEVLDRESQAGIGTSL